MSEHLNALRSAVQVLSLLPLRQIVNKVDVLFNGQQPITEKK